MRDGADLDWSSDSRNTEKWTHLVYIWGCVVDQPWGQGCTLESICVWWHKPQGGGYKSLEKEQVWGEDQRLSF